ncbi:MAG TPA: peptidyl-prolyl cis-trans isomerase [Terriglobales bacterium]|nr:peptidyl-prolyl cis-trans isomerase [Terriglobales bacterium]
MAAQDAKPASATPTPAPAAQSAAPASQPAAPAPAAPNAQTASPKPAAPAPASVSPDLARPAEKEPAAAPEPALPPTTPVITLNFCEGAASSKTKTAAAAPQAGCKKVITKAQFDKVLDAAIPRSRRPAGGEIPQQVKGAVAKEYLNMYLMAHEAEKMDLEHKDPMVREMLELSRMQVLSMALNQQLQEKTKPTDAEIEKYYNDNPSAFMEIGLRRLYIPKPATPASASAPTPSPTPGPTPSPSPSSASAANAAPKPAAPKPEDVEAQKAAAEKFHDRAAAGEDLDKLEKEAFDAAGSKQTPPPTQMGNRRHNILPPDQDADVFALNPGQVSKLYENPGGWYLYKVESKRTLALNDVKEEIQRKLQPEKLNDARQAITGKIKSDLNEKYFGGSTGPESMGSAPGPAGKASSSTAALSSRQSSLATKTGAAKAHKTQQAQKTDATAAH